MLFPLSQFLFCPYDLTTLVFLAFPVLMGEGDSDLSFDTPIKFRLRGTLSEMSLRQIAGTSAEFSIL